MSTRLPYLLLIFLIGFTSLCIRGLLTLHEWLHSPKLMTTYPVEATNQLLLINAACLPIPPLPIPLFSACAMCGWTTTWKRRIIGRLNTKHMQTIGLLWIGISITRSPWLYHLYFFWPLLPILFFFESQMCPWLWISFTCSSRPGADFWKLRRWSVSDSDGYPMKHHEINSHYSTSCRSWAEPLYCWLVIYIISHSKNSPMISPQEIVHNISTSLYPHKLLGYPPVTNIYVENPPFVDHKNRTGNVWGKSTSM